MDSCLSPEERAFRQEVRAFFASPAVRDALDRYQAGRARDGDPVELLRLLGAQGLLAPSWPQRYGGRGRSNLETAILSEELVLRGVPDWLHVLSIQIVGEAILRCGTEAQRAAYLPRLARAETFGSVLYTEREAGSDLGSMSARAVAEADGGFLLTARKIYNMKTALSEFALLAANTGAEGDRKRGITLFIVPLRTAGASVRVIPSLAEEPFHEVCLDQVRVGPEAVLGEVGGGWTTLMAALALERTGHDYMLKALRWLRQVEARGRAAGLHRDARFAGAVARFEARLEAGRLLAYQVLRKLDGGVIDDVAAAMSKWFSSELATAIVAFSAEWFGLGEWLAPAPGSAGLALETAYRDAPGTTLSAGSSEMMLNTVVRFALAAE